MSQAANFRGARMRSKRLERLMSSGLIEGYGQRVQIAFNYLVLDDRCFFTLKDLAERGKTVFNFLSIPGHDNSFAIMDSFRQFDRGGGVVFLQDFGAGVVERLYQFHNNNSLLKNIARELAPSGRRSVSEVLSCLDDLRQLSTVFKSNLAAHLSVIKAVLVDIQLSGALSSSVPSALGSSVGSSSNIGNALTTNAGSTVSDYISVTRLAECIQKAIDISCADVCAALHLSGRLRKQLQDESITGYHYCVGSAEFLLTAALSSYKWDAGYPFWGGRQAVEKFLGGGADDASSSGSQHGGDEDIISKGAEDGVTDSEGLESVLLGALEFMLPKGISDKAMELDEVQLYLLQKAQNAMNQFIILLSDPTSPLVLQEVSHDIAGESISDLDKSISNKLGQPLSLTPNRVKSSTPSNAYTDHRSGLSPRPGGKSEALAKVGEVTSLHSSALLQQLMETQDKLLRAQIRLQVYQKLQSAEAEHRPNTHMSGDSSTCHSEDTCSDSDESNDNSDGNSDGSIDSFDSRLRLDDEVYSNLNQKPKRVHMAKSVMRKIKKQRRAARGNDSDTNSSKASDDDRNEDSAQEDDASQSSNDMHCSEESGQLSSEEHSMASDEASLLSSALSGSHHGGKNKSKNKIPKQREIPMEVLESCFTELDNILTNVAGENYVLGTLLEHSCAIVPYEMLPQASGQSSLVWNAAEQRTIQPFRIPVAAAETPAEDTKKERDVSPPVPTSVLMSELKLPDIAEMGNMLRKLKAAAIEKQQYEQTQESLQMKLQMFTERIAEHQLQLEQMRRERDDAVSQAVEVQILREKNIRLSAEEANLHHLQQKNSELSRTVAELQRNLKETTELYSKAHHEENLRSQNQKQALLYGSTDNTTKAQLKQISELTSQRDKLSKENQRILLSSKQSDQRTKAALQDHLSLRQKLNKAEDELLSSKTVISNLLGEIDHERSLRGDRDTLVRKSQDLHMEVVELRGVVEENRVASAQLVKTKEELARAEDQISLLVEKLDDITKEAELSNIGQDQLDNLRAAVAQKAKENRELVVQTHNLERRLQELQGLETRHSDLCDEVTELKFKVDQMPPLLAELARLRGSHRATTRVLHEQEKVVSSLRTRSAELEADNARLRAQNRIIDDLQAKLKFSEADCQRYAEQTKEIPALNAQIKKLQEDYRSVDSSHRKLRKIMRQTAIMGGHNSSTADGGAN